MILSLTESDTMSQTTETRITRKGRSILWFQVAFGLALLIFMAVVFRSQTSSSSQRSLPHDIAGLSLTASMAGEEAMSEVNQLHGLNIPIQEAWIGHYGGQRATIWVSLSPSETDARSLFGAMAGKIGRGNEYFKNLQQLTVDGQKLYTVTAQDGQKHYFYQMDTKVIWIAAPVGQEMPFVQEAIRSL